MLGLNNKGSPDCILTKAPCGGREAPRTHRDGVGLTEGENFTVTFQKNLDHFNTKTPGYFSISLGPHQGPMKEVYKIADSAVPALTLFTTNITIPQQEKEGPMILQAQYITNNPAAPPAFYQCSDILVHKAKRPPPPQRVY